MIFFLKLWVRRIQLRNAAHGCGLTKDLQDTGSLCTRAGQTGQQIQQCCIWVGSFAEWHMQTGIFPVLIRNYLRPVKGQGRHSKRMGWSNVSSNKPKQTKLWATFLCSWTHCLSPSYPKISAIVFCCVGQGQGAACEWKLWSCRHCSLLCGRLYGVEISYKEFCFISHLWEMLIYQMQNISERNSVLWNFTTQNIPAKIRPCC